MVFKLKNKQSSQEKVRKKLLRKFLHYFPGGFGGKKYQSWERDYKWNAHLLWKKHLNKQAFIKLLEQKNYTEITRLAVWMESKTNLLFSFEKMALRDGVKDPASAKLFAEGLFAYIYGKKELRKRFEDFSDMLATLPFKQTRVLTWPVTTVFGFIADPEIHIYLKPTVTKVAAKKYQFDLQYSSKITWDTYESVLAFARQVETDTSHLHPKDMIDLQSFIWVLGSEEYPD